MAKWELRTSVDELNEAQIEFICQRIREGSFSGKLPDQNSAPSKPKNWLGDLL
jgi:hypothetical protein